MKGLKDMLNESLLPKDERELKKLGFKKQTEDREVWFEMTYKGKLIRIVQEEVGVNDWWEVKVESDYLRTDNDRVMTFETPLEAAEEVIGQIDNKLI